MHVMEDECNKPSPPGCEVDDRSASVAVTGAATGNHDNAKAEIANIESKEEIKQELPLPVNGLEDGDKSEPVPSPKEKEEIKENDEEPIEEDEGEEKKLDTENINTEQIEDNKQEKDESPISEENKDKIEEIEEEINEDVKRESEAELGAAEDNPASDLIQTECPESPEPQPMSPGVEEEEMQDDIPTTIQHRIRKRTSSESHSDCSSSAGIANGSEENSTPLQAKRLKLSSGPEREQSLIDFVDGATAAGAQELECQAEKLRQEIAALTELARIKEEEWNDLLRLRKFKEELLTRLQRRRRVVEMGAASRSIVGEQWDDASTLRLLPSRTSSNNAANNGRKSANSQQMMVPIISSTPKEKNASRHSNHSASGSSSSSSLPTNRLILPKPNIPTTVSLVNNNGQNPIIGEGRQGPILDVRSIIADYRSRHPETVPRRGRRMKTQPLSPNATLCTDNLVSSTRVSGGVLSMASLALGSGSHVRTTETTGTNTDHLNYLITAIQEPGTSRPSSADSSRSAPATSVTTNPTDLNISYKDVLVQYAKLSQATGENMLPKNLVHQTQQSPAPPPPPPPPPYPEVTLHPVTQSPPPPSTSLLHGILTKSTSVRPQDSSSSSQSSLVSGPRPTTFSPTLARLLTAPERITNSAAFMSGQVSLNDLLTTSKSRNEITITPVTTPQHSNKSKEMMEEEEVEDAGDRLVIDEGEDGSQRGPIDQESVPAPDDVPECQGCHQRAAQFVCAGCGNQWYCSRECQVSAWDVHSDVCSG